MTKKIKVMHIINNLEVGGAEKMLILLLKYLSKRDDIELYLVSLEGHGPLIKNLPDNIVVKEFNYHLFNPLFNRFDPYLRLGLLLYALKIKPDIIHGHLFKGEDFAKMLGFMIRVPVITTSHDTLVHPDRRSLFLNRYLTEAVAVSKKVADHLKNAYKLPVKKITIIPNAVEVKLFEKGEKEFNKNKPIFIYIGRLLKSKGIEDAMKGLARLKQYYSELEFLIYGKESERGYREVLEKLAKQNEWNFVKFMGRTDDVPSALKNGDIFVLPSRSEGFAISVLEAAAAGKPVIATKTGAIVDIVEEFKSGLFVDWGKPEQIYKAAKKILDDNLVESYGIVAKKKAQESFDIKKVVEMYHTLYLNVIQK